VQHLTQHSSAGPARWAEGGQVPSEYKGLTERDSIDPAMLSDIGGKKYASF